MGGLVFAMAQVLNGFLAGPFGCFLVIHVPLDPRAALACEVLCFGACVDLFPVPGLVNNVVFTQPKVVVLPKSFRKEQLTIASGLIRGAVCVSAGLLVKTLFESLLRFPFSFHVAVLGLDLLEVPPLGFSHSIVAGLLIRCQRDRYLVMHAVCGGLSCEK